MNNNPLDHIENLTKKTNDYMGERAQSVLGRYPLLFSLLSVFGVVAVLYGFESVINQISFLADRPFLIFITGLGILVFTGSLYKSLDRQGR
ncbi:MAG: hypothetical protein NUV42_01155 [Candidatus Yonathbacteria bacterium]|nr:hypothetical protein [Candidatus Yonathbacteria bacterium]